jgi:hypothetical protein
MTVKTPLPLGLRSSGPRLAVSAAVALLAVALIWPAPRLLAQVAAPTQSPAALDQAPSEMLPPTPTNLPTAKPLLDENLSDVPELFFQEPFPKHAQADWQKKMTKLVANIKKLNDKETDGFLKTLLEHRPDLAGLPMTMGDTCRMPLEQAKTFKANLILLRKSMITLFKAGSTKPEQIAPIFWQDYEGLAGKTKTATGYTRTQIAGLMQVLAIESAQVRKGLATFLAKVEHPEATRSLARLALFAPESEVRHEAARALKNRDQQEYTDILLAGLKYPWPVVAQHAAEALLELDRQDLVTHLVEMLDDPDPRLPVSRSVNGKEVFEVKQLVKFNHHQNCLLCHAPGDSSTPSTVLTVAVPPPGQPLPKFTSGYSKPKSQGENDIIVRIDITYMRQDFSLVQNVPNASPWPNQQRFDFVVRTATLTPAQAKSFQDKLQPKSGTATPYQEAVMLALRGLTGLNAEPTPQAWKRALEHSN